MYVGELHDGEILVSGEGPISVTVLDGDKLSAFGILNGRHIFCLLDESIHTHHVCNGATAKEDDKCTQDCTSDDEGFFRSLFLLFRGENFLFALFGSVPKNAFLVLFKDFVHFFTHIFLLYRTRAGFVPLSQFVQKFCL